MFCLFSFFFLIGKKNVLGGKTQVGGNSAAVSLRSAVEDWLYLGVQSILLAKVAMPKLRREKRSTGAFALVWHQKWDIRQKTRHCFLNQHKGWINIRELHLTGPPRKAIRKQLEPVPSPDKTRAWNLDIFPRSYAWTLSGSTRPTGVVCRGIRNDFGGADHIGSHGCHMSLRRLGYALCRWLSVASFSGCSSGIDPTRVSLGVSLGKNWVDIV